MAETSNQTPATPAEPVAVDLEAAADESAGVVSTEPIAEPVIPPSADPAPSSIEDLFRVGEEARKEAEEKAAAAQEKPAEPKKDEPVLDTPTEPPALPEEESPDALSAETKEPTPESDDVGDTTLVDLAGEENDDEYDDIPVDMKINSILLGKLDEALNEIKAAYKSVKEFEAAQNDPTSILKIGRASCRERVYSGV